MLVQFVNSRWVAAFLLLAVGLVVQLLVTEHWLVPDGIERLMAVPTPTPLIGNDIMNDTMHF